MIIIVIVKTVMLPFLMQLALETLCWKKTLIYMFCYLCKSRVVALLLNIIPHVVAPVDVFACLVSGPTLMVSTLIMVLYVVDQLQYEAELYYVLIELSITVIAFLSLIIVGKMQGAIYGLFYVDLMIAFTMDIYYMHKERGWTF